MYICKYLLESNPVPISRTHLKSRMKEWPVAEAEAEAYCRQSAGTLNPGTGPRWDPWPYILAIM
jgi:hypothetical protein